MKNIFFAFALLISVTVSFSQNNQLWKGYFSYNEIVDVASATNKIYATTEVSAFYKDLLLSNVEQINSVNGFKPEDITTIYYSDSFKKFIAGNSNGLLLIVNNDGTVVTKVDIIEEVPVAPNVKRVNSFYEYDGKLYISCDYGISVLNLATNEFVSTYFIGTSGEETKVYQTTVYNNELYAATQEFGIRKATVTNPFIYDFSQWQTFDTGYWNGIATFNNQLVAMNTNSRTYRYNGSSFVEILNHNQAGLTLKVNEGYLTVTTQNNVYVLDDSFLQVAHVTNIPDYSVIFTAATVVNDHVFIGTATNGLFSASLSNLFSFENLSPDGPVRNYIFRLKKAPNYLWAVYGDYTRLYNPYPLDEFGVSKYSGEDGWELLPYDDVYQAKSLSDIILNPNNANEVYIASYFSGLLKINGDNITLYNDQNTGSNGLESLVLSGNPNYVDIRINSLAFDREGNLWMSNAFVDRGLKVLRAGGQWQSYNLSNVLTNIATGRYGSMAIDNNLTKWLPTLNDGLLAYNEILNKYIVLDTETANLPDNDVRKVVIDNNNQLWIITYRGLRILYNVSTFLQQEELTTNNIVIQEGDLAQELFYQQSLIDIEVDGANRKWISVADGGVFLVSSNGQQTIYQFNKNNSPLPSNNVNDIEIDGVTGEIFFATDKGMVSFLGTSTKPSDDLENVYVYPNPVRPNYVGTIKIAGLTDKANVKITDIEGNLVFETTSAGGTIEWDGTAFGKHRVASGVYMIFVATEDGMDTTVKKVMIIR
ncbi:T9SS type A sorting domain-containing protein [Flavobacterium sp. NRK F10]|uniref:type IX secretion system anionic LPS delivery protein PorZ n=1 Tax=Flavobacterium sp. NRK F10 TaxID=2954931 RepID=UPI0020909CF0|nr:T9SS type A sorting domain-containing protein [Flavobacterium sp. NRK F10]MCO6174638.1 T9SS type A sorting domain-containing protein [Flavobacterium sp. NRK F10]